MKNSKNRGLSYRQAGFTLIELLVVIAIIGLLAAVVLVAVSGARNKGGDAAVESDLTSLQEQAEVDYDNSAPQYCYSYSTGAPGCVATGIGSISAGTSCPSGGGSTYSLFKDPVITGQIANAVAAGGGLASCYLSSGGANSQYGVAVQLKSNLQQAWCVDSSGASEIVNLTGTSQTAVSNVLSGLNNGLSGACNPAD